MLARARFFIAALVWGALGLASAQTPRVPPAAKPLAAPVLLPTRCINLGNALEAPREGDWGYRIEPQHLDAIAAAGFTWVRLPVAWQNYAPPGDAPPFTLDPAIFARVDFILAEAQKRGLKVVLNVHHFGEINDFPETYRAKLHAVWAQIADHYQAWPDDALVFELLNEPMNKADNGFLASLFPDLIADIRLSNPTRYLMISGDNWGSLEGLRGLKLPDDPRLILSVHDYDPMRFTHQQASYEPDPASRYPARRFDRDAARGLKRRAEIAALTVAETGYPIFMGEFGVTNATRADDRRKYLQAARTSFEAQRLGWCAFSFGGTFALYDVDRKAWKPGVLDALGLKAAPSAKRP